MSFLVEASLWLLPRLHADHKEYNTWFFAGKGSDQELSAFEGELLTLGFNGRMRRWRAGDPAVSVAPECLHIPQKSNSKAGEMHYQIRGAVVFWRGKYAEAEAPPAQQAPPVTRRRESLLFPPH